MTDRPLRPMQDAVYGILAASPCPPTCRQIAAQLDRPTTFSIISGTANTLRHMERLGLVRCVGREPHLHYPKLQWEARA